MIIFTRKNGEQFKATDSNITADIVKELIERLNTAITEYAKTGERINELRFLRCNINNIEKSAEDIKTKYDKLISAVILVLFRINRTYAHTFEFNSDTVVSKNYYLYFFPRGSNLFKSLVNIVSTQEPSADELSAISQHFASFELPFVNENENTFGSDIILFNVLRHQNKQMERYKR